MEHSGGGQAGTETNTVMKLTQKTRIDGKPGLITGIDIAEIVKDTWLHEQIMRLGILGMTYRAKTRLVASGKLRFTFAALKSLWLQGGGTSIGVEYIDEAIENLRIAGVKIADRPRKVKGETGSESPTTWAQRIDLHEKVGEHYTDIAKKWGAEDFTVKTLANYAALLQWHAAEILRKARDEQQADFTDLK